MPHPSREYLSPTNLSLTEINSFCTGNGYPNFDGGLWT